MPKVAVSEIKPKVSVSSSKPKALVEKELTETVVASLDYNNDEAYNSDTYYGGLVGYGIPTIAVEEDVKPKTVIASFKPRIDISEE